VLDLDTLQFSSHRDFQLFNENGHQILFEDFKDLGKIGRKIFYF